jgi:hypothetical protein
MLRADREEADFTAGDMVVVPVVEDSMVEVPAGDGVEEDSTVEALAVGSMGAIQDGVEDSTAAALAGGALSGADFTAGDGVAPVGEAPHGGGDGEHQLITAGVDTHMPVDGADGVGDGVGGHLLPSAHCWA